MFDAEKQFKRINSKVKFINMKNLLDFKGKIFDLARIIILATIILRIIKVEDITSMLENWDTAQNLFDESNHNIDSGTMKRSVDITIHQERLIMICKHRRDIIVSDSFSICL